MNLGTITSIVKIQHSPLLPGRPLFTIATLASTAALLLTAIATAAIAVAGALPKGMEHLAGTIVQSSAIAGALALGLGCLGKSVYAIAAASTRPPLEPVTLEQSPGALATPDGIATTAPGAD